MKGWFDIKLNFSSIFNVVNQCILFCRYNLCQGDLQTVKESCLSLLHNVFRPAIAQPPKEFHIMHDALLKGSHNIVPFVDPGAFWTFSIQTLELPCEVPELNAQSKKLLNLQVIYFIEFSSFSNLL